MICISCKTKLRVFNKREIRQRKDIDQTILYYTILYSNREKRESGRDTANISKKRHTGSASQGRREKKKTPSETVYRERVG